MSVSPTSGMRKLSLESYAQEAKPRLQMESSQGELAGRGTGRDQDTDDDGSISGDSMEENATIIRSPTGLRYNISHLSDETQDAVRSLFASIVEEPFEIALKWCDRLHDQEGNDDFYAFQMSEVVPRSVRIGSPQSRYREPECRCGAKPCKHLIWLSDLIASQVLYNHDPDTPLTLNERGYADELGSPFTHISEMRLDVLASSLHCDVGHPASNPEPSTSRKAEAREILASVADVDELDLPSYRTDLQEDGFDHTSLVHHSDLEATLFSLLLASHSLTALVRSQLRPSAPARDPFRLIHQRVLRIISDLEAYSSALRESSSTSEPARRSSGTTDTDGPRDVPWAARSIERCVEQIRTMVAARSPRDPTTDPTNNNNNNITPLAPWERASAARALVRILRAVAERNADMHGGARQDDRNLYARLIGNRDTGFVHAALALLVDQNQFVDELEDILELVGANGVMASWLASMRRVVGGMRRWKGGPASATATITSNTGASAKAKAPLAATSTDQIASLMPPTGPSRGGRADRGGRAASSSGSATAGLKRSGVGSGSDRGSKRMR